jgi:hypothetical protein
MAANSWIVNGSRDDGASGGITSARLAIAARHLHERELERS